MIEFIVDPGCNFTSIGDLKSLMRRCKEAGATYFKPQLWECDDLYSPENNPFYEWQKSHELTYEQAKEIFNYGKKIELEVFFSVYDTDRVGWCERIGVERYKIAARSINDMNLQLAISDTQKLPIMSRSVDHFSENSNRFYRGVFKDLKILYSRSLYPTPFHSLNFAWMVEEDGFSDHTKGIEMSMIAASLAIAKGKKNYIIEKHAYYGSDIIGKSPDMCVSISMLELSDLIVHVRRMEQY